MNLRRGTPEDVPVLDSIARAAKVHWGYSAHQIALWQHDLRVKPDSLASAPVCLAESDGQTLGFVQIATNGQPWELDSLFVHPDHMRKGVGKALLQWALHYAVEHGQLELAIDSDPNAAEFYLAHGAILVGCVAAPIQGHPQRVRPQLRLLARAGCVRIEPGANLDHLRVTEIKAFVPSKDFEASKQFYRDLGFTMASEGGGVAYFHFANVSFLLQDFCADGLAENFMMHILVEDVDAWWAHVRSTGVVEKFDVRCTDIEDQPWGMRDFCLSDPSGVLWRIGQNTH